MCPRNHTRELRLATRNASLKLRPNPQFHSLMQHSPRIALLLCAILDALVTLAVPCPAATPQHDLVIHHGKITDGSGNPWFWDDVAITGDRITAIGVVTGVGKRELDARGLVVAPGSSTSPRTRTGCGSMTPCAR